MTILLNITVQMSTKRTIILHELFCLMVAGNQHYSALLPPTMTKQERKETGLLKVQYVRNLLQIAVISS